MKTLVSSWLLLISALALLVSIAAFAKATDLPPATGTGYRLALRGDRALGPFTIFDLNHDGVISADEIAAVPATLRKLDKNGDGELTANELRPPVSPPPRDETGSGAGRPGSDGDDPPPCSDPPQTPPLAP